MELMDERLAHYPLWEALMERRSRRFGKGMRLNGGPLAYESSYRPQPLSMEEEAALAFAACGITGFLTAELPYQTGNVPEAGTGNVMINFIGRTAISGDAAHSCAVFVFNDDGVWMLKRPQDYALNEGAELINAARQYRLVELYEKSRVRIADQRLELPRKIPFVPPFNKWSANVPGSTYFLPIAELTALQLNILLAILDEELGFFPLDDRNQFRPAGVAKFGRSKGGHLYDDPKAGRLISVSFIESPLHEAVAIEQGAILQNLSLMTQALGLGGFPHFAAQPFFWFQTLGFRMEEIPFSHLTHAGAVKKLLLKAFQKDVAVPTAVGLERNGEVLIKPFCPPYYRTMEEAVVAFVDYKFAEGSGTNRDGGRATAWRDGQSVQNGIPRSSDKAIAATIAYCEYIYRRYGRFPAHNGALRSIIAFQAHHLDLDFYDRFYRPEALSETQRLHQARWHENRPG